MSTLSGEQLSNKLSLPEFITHNQLEFSICHMSPRLLRTAVKALKRGWFVCFKKESHTLVILAIR